MTVITGCKNILQLAQGCDEIENFRLRCSSIKTMIDRLKKDSGDTHQHINEYASSKMKHFQKWCADTKSFVFTHTHFEDNYNDCLKRNEYGNAGNIFVSKLKF